MNVQQLLGSYLVNPNVLLTAGLAIVVEDISLLYVAHSGTIEVVSYSRSTQSVLLHVYYIYTL